MNVNSSGIPIPHPDDAYIPVTRFSQGAPLHDQSVLDLLQAEDNDNWLYRGQLDRFYRPWPAEDKQNGNGAIYAAGSYMLESLIPSDYRGLEDGIRAGKKSDSDVRLAYGNEITLARVALVLSGLHTLADNDATGVIASWHGALPSLHGNSPNPNTNYITSLGQHIDIPSGNMDLTHSPEVAWWFATHSWSGVYQSGEGVIYRISRNDLENTLNQLPNAMGHQVSSAYQLIDISNGLHAVPNALTPRPVAQEGLTLAGGEVGEVLLHLIQMGAITAYVFQRDHTAYPRGTASIKPLPDPLADFITQARAGVWNVFWQDTVNTLYVHFHCAFIPNITDLRIRTAVFDGYTGLTKLPPHTP